MKIKKEKLEQIIKEEIEKTFVTEDEDVKQHGKEIKKILAELSKFFQIGAFGLLSGSLLGVVYNHLLQAKQLIDRETK